MLRMSQCLRWTPNYFRGQTRMRGGGSGRGNATTSSQAAPPPQPRLRSPRSRRPARSQAARPPLHPSSMAYVTAVAPSFPEVMRVREAAGPLAARAQELVEAWPHRVAAMASSGDDPSPVSSSRTLSNHSDHAQFVALREVLGPLALALPPPPPHLQTPAAPAESDEDIRTLRGGRFRVLGNPVAAQERQAPACPAPAPLPTALPVSSLSLEETVSLLELYRRTECEDGQLLLQLLGETHRFFMGTLPRVAPAVVAAAAPPPPLAASVDSAMGCSKPTAAKLPLPQLLLALSSLGLTEEEVLRAIVVRPTTGAGQAGALYAQLPHYTAAELAILLVALHRFGLAQDAATRETVKTLRRVHTQRPHSDAFGYLRAIQALTRRQDREAARADAAGATHAPLSVEELTALGGATPAAEQSLFDQLPPLPRSLRCETGVLVEALTALALSIFRTRGAVSLLSHMLVGNAVEEMTEVLSPKGGTTAEKRAALTLLSRQLLRATRVCEEMLEPQSLLAGCLAFSLDVAKAGVLADGGEDADVPSEQRAYYDHVTADLVKVNRTL